MILDTKDEIDGGIFWERTGEDGRDLKPPKKYAARMRGFEDGYTTADASEKGADYALGYGAGVAARARYGQVAARKAWEQASKDAAYARMVRLGAGRMERR
jgi:hypothetical protein